MSWNVSGFNELGRQLQSLVSQLEGTFRSEVLEPVGQPAGALAQAEAPVRTGYLRAHTGFRVISNTEGELFSDADYAASINYGTSKNTRGTGFFTNAANQMERDLPVRAQTWIKNALK